MAGGTGRRRGVVTLHVEQRGRTLLLTLDDPATRNALSPAIYRAGADAIARAAVDPAIGAVVLTGANGTFCSGGDLKRLAALRAGPADAAGQGVALLHAWIRALKACPKPTIAAVEGVAAGAGVSLALACDLIIATVGARFILAQAKVGLSPDGGALWTLARGAPRQFVAAAALEGAPILAERLKHLGFIAELVDPGEAAASALARAEALAAGPGAAQARIKALLAGACDDGFDAHLDREQAAFVANLLGPEAGEGVAAFLEKRRPDFLKTT